MQNLAPGMAAAATPTKFTRAHVTARVASTPKVSPQIIWSEAGLPKIAQHMFSLMLRNLASDGFLFLDPNHPDPTDPQSFSLPGCIIAAPSFPANTPGIDQDYVYNWTRDAAIAAIEIAAAEMPTAPGSGVQPLIDYVNFAQICQNNATPSLALASYTIRGLSRQWTEQTDGPALQTLAILMAYDQLDTPTQAIRRFRRPKQDGQIRITQAFVDFRNKIAAEFNIDLANPRLDILSFELGSEHLDELLVFRAVGKKDFHPMADTLGHIIAIDRLEGKTSCSKRRLR